MFVLVMIELNTKRGESCAVMISPADRATTGEHRFTVLSTDRKKWLIVNGLPVWTSFLMEVWISFLTKCSVSSADSVICLSQFKQPLCFTIKEPLPYNFPCNSIVSLVTPIIKEAENEFLIFFHSRV